MDVSILIPTHARPDALGRCIAALARDHADDLDAEILVGIDGPDRGEADAAVAALDAAGSTMPMHIVACDRAGPAATRNRLVERARSPLLLFLNDDVLPMPGLVRAHADAQLRLFASGRRAMVLGDAPWVVHQPDRLFDRLIRSTSMIFFYDRMRDPDPLRDWGYRHAWTLNLSLPRSLLTDAGGFDESFTKPCYEDIELAWRLCRHHGAAVLYHPEAAVLHDHRYEPPAYLAREADMGAEAFRLACEHPDFARELFHRDLTDDDELAYAEQYVAREQPHIQKLEQSFLALADLPATAVDAPHADTLLGLLYEHHLPLKRFHFRRGLLHARSLSRAPAALPSR